MTPRQRRIVLVVGILAGVSLAGVLALRAFQDNVMFFFDPTQVAAARPAGGTRSSPSIDHSSPIRTAAAAASGASVNPSTASAASRYIGPA